MKLKEKQGGRESAGRSMCELLLHNHNFVFSKECARPREQPAGSYWRFHQLVLLKYSHTAEYGAKFRWSKGLSSGAVRETEAHFIYRAICCTQLDRLTLGCWLLLFFPPLHDVNTANLRRTVHDYHTGAQNNNPAAFSLHFVTRIHRKSSFQLCKIVLDAFQVIRCNVFCWSVPIKHFRYP